jgi:hypothetical protein
LPSTGKIVLLPQTATLQICWTPSNNDADANVTIKYSRLKDAFTVTAIRAARTARWSIVNKSGNAFGADGAFQICHRSYHERVQLHRIIDGVTVERTE